MAHAIVVGHSLGGAIAVLFGEPYPHDAAAIVTVEGGYPIAPTQQQRDARVAQSITSYQGIAQDHVAEALRTNMLQYTITRKPDVDRATRLAATSAPTAIVAPFTAIIPFDAQIDPYQGFKTAADKKAAYEAWVTHTRDGTVIEIEHSRHFVMIDQPVAFERVLESGIAR